VLEPFLLQPFFALILIAISCSLLGIFVLWKKLSYFGDALSHSILLGLVLGSIFAINQVLMLSVFAIIFSATVSLISQNRYFSKDIIIMITAYFCIALAILVNDFWLKDFNFSSYIFGDLLTVGSQEIKALTVITTLVIFFVFFTFKKMLLINVSADLARVDGVKTEILRLSFLIILSLVIALSVRIVGVFLMTALLILPAAIARIFSVSAKQMLILSLIIGTVVSSLSFKASIDYDLTVSPVVITIFSLIFFASLALKKIFFK
jgi:zinc transport system permease protein